MNNNFFEIKTGGKVIVKHNAVKNAFAHFLAGLSYAAYMRIASKDRCIYKPTTIEKGNFDINKGKLFVKVSATFLQSEFSEKVIELGLCPQPYTALSDICKTEFLPRGKVTVSATLYLTSSGDVTFCGGDNVLIKSLLGVSPLPVLTVKGANRTSAVDFVTDVENYENVDAEIKTEKTLTIDIADGNYNDYVIMAGSTPVARFNSALFAPVQETRMVTSNDGFYAEALRVGGMSGSYIQIALPSALGACVEFSGDGRLIADPTHSYVYIVSEGKVYDVRNPFLPKYVCDGENVRACADGSVAVNNGTEITIFGKNKQTINCNGDEFEVIYRNGGYDVYTLSDGTLYVYRVDGAVTEAGAVTVSGDSLHTLSPYAVVVCGQNATSYYLCGSGGFSQSLANLTTETVSDGCYYGDGYAGSVYSYFRTDCAKAKNGFCVKDGKLYCIIANMQCLGEYDFDDIVMANDKIYIIKDGVLSCYGFQRKGVYVCCDSGKKTYTAYVAPTGEKTVRLKIAGTPIG